MYHSIHDHLIECMKVFGGSNINHLMVFRLAGPLLLTAIFVLASSAQVDEICREFGAVPSLEAPKLQAPFVFGKIKVSGVAPDAKLPKITIAFSDARQPLVRQTLEGSGNYCFKRTGGDGILVIHVGSSEFVRKTIPAFGPPQQREDFEIHADDSKGSGQPGILSARFSYKRSERSTELFLKAAEAEKQKSKKRAIEFMKEAVKGDPADFIAWAKIGSLHFEQNEFPEAEAAFKKSLELRVDYTPAWLFMGRIRMAQNQYEIAAEIFKQAIETDPQSARAYQLLGETYLLSKKGTLGAEALNKAIELDPDGMAENHLLLAKLYDLAGAKSQAAHEYRAFLKKVSHHPDKEKFEKYIRENP